MRLPSLLRLNANQSGMIACAILRKKQIEEIREVYEYFITVMKREPESGKQLADFARREADAGRLPSRWSSAASVALAAADYIPKLLAYFTRIHARNPWTREEFAAFLKAELDADRLPGPREIDRLEKH